MWSGILKTLNDILFERAHFAPDEPVYRFFEDGLQPPVELSASDLLHQAAGIAAHLQAHGLTAQEPVLLIGESQRCFVIGFYACLLAGAIAVPSSPPRRAALSSRLQLLARDAGARFVLSDCSQVLDDDWTSMAVARFDLRELIEKGDTHGWGADLHRPALHAAAIAFLQYTSGSTGDPKGVMVSHTNLIANSADIQAAMHIDDRCAVLTALPLFHDMGLIGGLVQSMYSGCIGHFMSPAEFVQYPERWIQRIAAFGITHSGGPNFMFEHAARDIEPSDIADCDLSAWRVAFSGAEPIRAATIGHFTERFATYGFQAGAFYPCYGMAESTLFITGSQVGIAPLLDEHQGCPVVGCGTTRGAARVVIVDPETRRRLPSGAEGEIWTSSDSVAQGYWKRTELTEQVFGARIEGEQSGRFLRTGDLGYLRDGQLFVTGRLKDLVILYGRKYVPHDIEAAAGASHVGLRQDGGAAFSVEAGGTERLVVVYELERVWVRRSAEHARIATAIARAVSAAQGIQVDDVILIRPGALPRTSSGKVRRGQCRLDYLSGALQRIDVSAAEPIAA
jgi:acyl-CoA synthetase (AMP-forming)/AMP-acid ligase II